MTLEEYAQELEAANARFGESFGQSFKEWCDVLGKYEAFKHNTTLKKAALAIVDDSFNQVMDGMREISSNLIHKTFDDM